MGEGEEGWVGDRDEGDRGLEWGEENRLGSIVMETIAIPILSPPHPPPSLVSQGGPVTLRDRTGFFF